MKRIGAWFGGHPLRPALAALAAIMALGAAGPLVGPPLAVRDWYPYLAQTAQVAREGAGFTVSPVSDWRYGPEGPTHQLYRSAAFNFEALRAVWFVLEPQPGSRLAAHTLLLFEFEGDRLLGVTIEARRERDEQYSAIAGLFNAFELAYVWGSARDFLTRRAVMLDHEVFVYPLAITAEQQRTLLENLLDRTAALAVQPRFYNTIHSNCTNELAKAAGLSWAPAFVLTGLADEHLYARGIIPGESFERAHAQADMTAFIRAHNEAAAFDAALLGELRRRNGL